MNKRIKAVYKITNIVTGIYYIGSSINVKSRLANHKRDLEKNRHCNPHLQASFNKHGFDVFTFEILEQYEDSATVEFVRGKEQDLLDNIQDWSTVFNIDKSVLFADTSSKLSKSNLGRIPWNKGIARTDECKKKISDSQIGTKQTEDRIMLMIRSVRKSIKDGGKGVSFHKKADKWRATISINKKSKHLGLFNTYKEAFEARVAAEEKYWSSDEEYFKEPDIPKNHYRKSGSDIKMEKSGKWKARINTGKVRLTLGLFTTYEEALQARLEAEKKYWV
jgi:group I intron endonuclease